MKFDKTENNSPAQPSARDSFSDVSAAEAAADTANDVNLSGDSAVDNLQACVYKAGMRLLPILKKTEDPNEAPADGADSKSSETKLSETVSTALKELGHFAYDIGFAGEQSCGKSTVINSLLRYPLMPTCKAPTTASVVQIVYSDHFRVRAIDDDTQKVVLDYDCEIPKNPAAQKIFRERFDKLMDYAVSAMDILVIENFQYFTDVKIVNKRITVKDVEMTPEDPKHVMLLLFVLLAVYVGQNDANWTEEKRELMEKRKGLFTYLGIPNDTINISVKSQGQFEILKSGLIITDLPGLGSTAAHQERSDGRKVKGHDEITKEAIQQTDTMVFITTPENRVAGYEVLPDMISSAKLKETVCKGDRIIPVLNKVDTCGEQEKRTTIQSFCTALAALNVEKKPEDIRLYAGILGEYKFSDIPFERSIYYKNQIEEEDLREQAEFLGQDFEELKSSEIRKLLFKMKKGYEKSGIEELLKFFRTTYVEVGKYNKSTSALQAMRAMVLDIISRLNTTASICKNRLDNQTKVQKELIENLEDAVKKPLAEALERSSEQVKRITVDSKKDCADSLEPISMVYTKAFEKSLKVYKENLLKTLDLFKLNFLGLSDRARIDVPGSDNRIVYLALLDEVDEFPVSLTEVNGQYENLLKKIRTRIDRFYADSLSDLKKLKNSIGASLNCSIESAQKNISVEELKSLEAVRDQLLILVEKQIDIVTLNFEKQQQAETDAMRNILAAIFDASRIMTEAYVSSIKKQLVNNRANGVLFSTREYLLVDGVGGMKAAVISLKLTEEDSDHITLNLSADVNKKISVAIGEWSDSLYRIALMYDELATRLEKPLKEIIDVMTGSAEESSEKLEETKKQILDWYGICLNFHEEVQPKLQAARDHMKDREASNGWLLDNIFYNCFNEEVKEEYERERKSQKQNN